MKLPFAALTAVLLLAAHPDVPAAAKTDPAKRNPTRASAPLRDPATSIVPIAYQKFTLQNGLTVIVHEDRKTPVVAVGIWYHVGSANETKGRTGFAHLFEHLMFNGSQHANTDWFEEMNAVGASNMNGSTSFDTTQYYQVVPRIALDRVLWLESDRMQNLLPAVDQAKLDEQRKVVQNEKRQRESQPLGALLDVLLRGSFPEGHPYNWAPIGSMEDLNAATLDDVRNFFNTWYRPNNAVLVLSGDIGVAEARAKVEHYFGSIPAGPALNRTETWVAKRADETRAQMDVQVANPIIFKFWNIPGRASPDAVPLELAAQTMGSGETSFLHRRLVRERRLASEVKTGIEALELGSLFQVFATALPGVSAAQIEAALNEEIEAYLRTGPTAAELDRLKLGRYADYVRAQSSTLGKASRLAESEIYGGTPAFDTTQQQRYQDATPQSVIATARKWISDGAFVIEARPIPEYKTSTASVDRGTKPMIGRMADFRLPPLQHATLSNGMKVLLAERHDVPTLGLSMFFDVGVLPDRNPASVGLGSALTMPMMGTDSRTRQEISEEIQRLGANINLQFSTEDARFNMNALKPNLDKTLALYADILQHPAFPEKEWALQRDKFVADYADSLKSPVSKFRRVVNQMIYGPDHPYAVRSTPETIAQIDVAELRDFYRKWIRPETATMLIVGDTTLAEIMPKLEAHLGGWKSPPGPAVVKPPLPPVQRTAGPRVVLIDQPGAQSTIIKVAQTSVARSDPEFERLNLVNTIVGGHFLSRLNMNLREKKGWSYGASSNLNPAPLIGTVDAGGSVQADKTAEAMREIDRELREIATTRPPTDAEIATAKNALLLRMPAMLESPSGLMSFYMNSLEYDLPEDYWNGYISRVQALSPDQIRAAARRLFKPSEFTWIVVGDLSKIESDVRKLDLGEVIVVDGEGRRIR